MYNDIYICLSTTVVSLSSLGDSVLISNKPVDKLLSPDLTYALLAREGPVEKPVEDRVGGQAVKSFASIGRDEGEDMFFEFLLSIYLKT